MSDPQRGRDRAAFRMEPLATLPVFFKLGGKRVVMAGGDAPAVWKAELIAAAGADVHVFAAAPCSEMLALAAAPPAGSVVLVARHWTPGDLGGAALAIGAIEDADEAETFRAAAREAGVPVNVIDKPAFCDFQFGTIVARSPLVIGISTDGAAPVFGQAVRARIEAVLPQGLRRWAEAAKAWRPAVQALDLDFRRRRHFWEVFADRAFARAEAAPTTADRDACLTAVQQGSTQATGRLTWVGAGRGDVASMTLQAVAALQSADAIFYDPDVSVEAIGLSRREASKEQAVADLDAMQMRVRAMLDAGKHVAWLGTGNPALCARWAARLSAPGFDATEIGTIAGLSLCPACAKGCEHPAA